MSSPQAGLEMLQARRSKHIATEYDEELNPLLEAENADSDVAETDLIESIELQDDEINTLDMLIEEMQKLKSIKQDKKVAIAVSQVSDWIKQEVYPIVFCRYIATAKYIGELLKDNLPNNVDVQIITSEFADEQRREMIDAMGKSKKRVLIATDCLSEGINLQEHFTAVLHYDLPWNPNRLEQREGRVDRYGQAADTVYAYLLWGEDNPIDAVVLKVLIKKIRDIQKATGVSIVIGDENKSIVDTVLKEILLEPSKALASTQQMNLDFGELSDVDKIITNQLEKAKEKAEKLRSIFAHESVDPKTIEAELKEVDEVIGDVSTVENFVVQACRSLGAIVNKEKNGYTLDRANLPQYLKQLLPDVNLIPLSFDSPTPKGRVYIGRNSKFVEQLAQLTMALAFEKKSGFMNVARASVIQTEAVNQKTTIVQFRVRNVIKEVGRNRELIAEEMYLWGHAGNQDNREILDYTTCKSLLLEAQSAANIAHERQTHIFDEVAAAYDNLKQEVQALSEERAKNLVQAHSRFKELVGGRQYEAVHPVLPPDVMGIYVLMPKPKVI
jgi:superfamily II DNA/RNA helicase